MGVLSVVARTGGDVVAQPAQIPSFSDSALVRLDPPAPTRPPRLPFLDATSLLFSARGVWTYDFGTPGWPDGWSPHGIDPGQTGLVLEGIPFDDPVTGRPTYELLPYDKLASLQRAGMVRGRPEGLSAVLAPFETSRPVTELVYRSTNTGLQTVSVVHAQTRAAGAEGKTQYLFGYEGAGARGEYDGSRLRRKRQILLRLKRETPRLRIEIGEMFNRHRVGAQSGVEPFEGYEYESIYQRVGAAVGDESATRQNSRNDAWLEVAFPKAGLTTKAYWTVSTLKYRLSTDTTIARVSRVGAVLRQGIWGERFSVNLSGHVDSYPTRPGWTWIPPGTSFGIPPSRAEAVASLSGNHRLGSGRISWSAGIMALKAGFAHVDSEPSVVEPVISADMDWLSGIVRPFIHSRNGTQIQSASDVFGFGDSVVPLEYSRVGRQAVDEIGISFRPGWLHLQASVAASRSTGGTVRMLDATGDTLSVVPYDGLRSRTSATARLGLREFSRRGFYFWAEATTGFYDGVQPDLDARLEDSVPEIFGKAAIGIRGIVFQGDLDGDLAIRARAWTEHNGLRFHPQTGLLALPDPDSRPLEQSLIFDLVGIAHIRSATLTVSLENFLSGTTLTPGNQLVPDYPYPARRLRFSVFWPIFD